METFYLHLSISVGKSSLWQEKRMWMVGAHRVSYLIHKGQPNKDAVIRHTCDNPGCVNPGHLEEDTQTDNMQDAVKRKQLNQGSKSKQAKLTERDVWLIRLCMRSYNQNQLAAKFGVSQKVISDIKNRRTWRHV